MSHARAKAETTDAVIRLKGQEFLQFLEHSQNHCVGIVDMINSTKATSELSEAQIDEFYSIFLGSMDSCVSSFGGTSIKNMGDALLFSFPDNSLTYAGKSSFERAIECCMAMIRANGEIRSAFKEKSLQPIRYRISAAYGPVRIAKLSASAINDIFGHTVNLCAKINCLAPADGLIIDEFLYKKARLLDGYLFRRIRAATAGNMYRSEVYVVHKMPV